MGKRLARHGLEPDLLLTSSATRARETARLFAAALGGQSIETRVEPDIYLASPGELLAVLKTVEDDVGELVLIGHNPGFTLLANMLLPEIRLANLPTAGAVCIDCDTESWQEIDDCDRRLVFYDFPKTPEPV